jgi:cell fate regulator YaaT (PSP1 superfamily)
MNERYENLNAQDKQRDSQPLDADAASEANLKDTCAPSSEGVEIEEPAPPAGESGHDETIPEPDAHRIPDEVINDLPSVDSTESVNGIAPSVSTEVTDDTSEAGTQESGPDAGTEAHVPTAGGAEGQAGAEAECPRRVLLKAGTDEESLKALALCREKVTQLHLRMHPLAARWESDRHVVIFFRADDKVDFRKLVRELSRLLHARIELRQVGPREQGKLCGLVGKCGYPLCCQTFLGQFAQSTIKMAKTQELALNPMKISGVCGRLLCCLNYEQEMYLDAKSRMPRVNRMVQTEFGLGRVVAVNVLKETVTVQFETMTKELRPDQVQLAEVQG